MNKFYRLLQPKQKTRGKAKVEITKEMLQQQLNKTIENAEGFKNGYVSAFQWVAAKLEEKPETPKADDTKGV